MIARSLVLASCALLLSAAGCAAVGNAAQDARATREAAYRANNIGVAHLEQYDFDAATAAFRRALAQDNALAIAQLNLGIALFYAGQPDEARRELERVRPSLPGRPQADYVLGILARAGGRTTDALEAFGRAQGLDSADAGIEINIGQIHLQERRYAEAIASFRRAAAAEPFNATAAYGLATALIRGGDAVEGKTAMERFERLRASSYATTFSQAYLEQGRYAEAIASTGLEAGLVDERNPDVAFVNATTAVVPGAVSSATGAVTLFDLDADGDLDLADAAGPGIRVYRNDGGRLSDLAAFAAPLPGVTGIAAADCDNDGDVDLVALSAAGARLYRQDAPGRFVDSSAAAGLAAIRPAPRSAAWLDLDHDGDLDLVIAGAGDGASPSVQVLQNSGDGTFTNITTSTGVVAPGPVVAAVPTDFDNRRDIDLLLVTVRGGALLMRNLRDGSFRDVASDVGLALDGELTSVAIGDINKDGYPDLFFGRAGAAGVIAASDGRGRFVMSAALASTAGALASQFLDFDGDGLLDLFVVTTRGPAVLRNLGTRWVDVSASAMRGAAPGAESAASLATGDLDRDGDIDVIMRGSSGLTIWRNEAARPSRSLRVRLTSRVSNRSAVGTKIEARAGSLLHRVETYAATPAPAPADIVFAFGDRPGADVARVLWPSGILQAETAAGGPASLVGDLHVQELDRKPSSCPYLYTWNGERFEFLTDFLGGGEMGYWLAPGVRNSPDPDEYIRIEERQLQARNGRFELRVTNELEEAVFLDRVQLVVVRHPNDVSVYPNEGLRSTPDPFRLFAIRDRRLPVAIEDEHGHDVLDRVSRMDRRSPDDFALEPVRGYAAEHSLTITLPVATGARRVLLLTGWTDYSFSGDNVAAHQRGLSTVPPALQIADANGVWRTVMSEIGFPVGRPQTVLVDLTGAVPAAVRQVRIVTTMRVYWDQIEVGMIAAGSRVATTRLEPLVSTLRWRGFSALTSPDGREPFGADYERVTPFSPWKLLPGRYTREGDVRELLVKTDDQFVVSRPGDEIAVSFDAAQLAPVPAGWTQTFLLYTGGFSKEMDLNSSSPDTLDPLPFHGMTRYPYPTSDAPRRNRGYREYLERYNTRIVKKGLPPLELSVPRQ